MVRKQRYIDERHERDLERRAGQLGVSEAELVRRALDRDALYGERIERAARDAVTADGS